MPVTTCECGCGEEAPIAKSNNKRDGIVKGQRYRFVKGHHARGRKGKEAFGWRGGRTRTVDGYRLVFMPEHPNARSNGYVPEHIYVAAKAMGKPVPKGAVVHHVNGDKLDNRPCNLVVLQDLSLHLHIHKRQRAFDASGHADWLRCSFCKQYSDPSEMYSHPTISVGYHRECNREYSRKYYHRVRKALPVESRAS